MLRITCTKASSLADPPPPFRLARLARSARATAIPAARHRTDARCRSRRALLANGVYHVNAGEPMLVSIGDHGCAPRESHTPEPLPPFPVDDDLMHVSRTHSDDIYITQRYEPPLRHLSKHLSRHTHTHEPPSLFPSHSATSAPAAGGRPLTPGRHRYFSGEQHLKKERRLLSTCDTGVFFWQSIKGQQRWPVTPEKLQSLRSAFESTKPERRGGQKVVPKQKRSAPAATEGEGEGEGGGDGEEGADSTAGVPGKKLTKQQARAAKFRKQAMEGGKGKGFGGGKGGKGKGGKGKGGRGGGGSVCFAFQKGQCKFANCKFAHSS